MRQRAVVPERLTVPSSKSRQVWHRLMAFVGALVLLPVFTTTPAQAANYEVLCSGYDSCVAAGYPDHGYKQAGSSMYWNMFSGHNCTNYAAYKVIRDGGPAKRPWTGGGNATYWGTSMSQLVDQTPAVGAIAWWLGGDGGMGSAGHVAYVEKVVSNDEVIISEDNWSGDFHWKRIKRASSVWPSGFIHFTADAAGNPTGSLTAATSPVRGQIRVTGWAGDPRLSGSAGGHPRRRGGARGRGGRDCGRVLRRRHAECQRGAGFVRQPSLAQRDLRGR